MHDANFSKFPDAQWHIRNVQLQIGDSVLRTIPK